jgi:hypothetical protein
MHVAIHCFSHHFVVVMVVIPRLTLQILFIHKKLIFNFRFLLKNCNAGLMMDFFCCFLTLGFLFFWFNPKIYLHKNTFELSKIFFASSRFNFQSFFSFLFTVSFAFFSLFFAFFCFPIVFCLLLCSWMHPLHTLEGVFFSILNHFFNLLHYFLSLFAFWLDLIFCFFVFP